PSGHTSRWWGRLIRHPDGRVEDEAWPWTLDRARSLLLRERLVEHTRQPHPSLIEPPFRHGQAPLIVRVTQLRPRLDPLARRRVLVGLPGHQQESRRSHSTVTDPWIFSRCFGPIPLTRSRSAADR